MRNRGRTKLHKVPQMVAGRRLIRVAGVVAAIAGLSWAPLAQAATAGQITHLSGTLVGEEGGRHEQAAGGEIEVMEGDTLGTESETYARVKFNDGGEVVMRPGTQLKIESYSYNAAKPESDSIVMSMFKGGLRAVTGLIGKRNREKVSFQTETATIGIRGTHFGAHCCARTTAGGCRPREAIRRRTDCTWM
jgi:hypothetical protein